jgi:hypothetical protein
MFNSRKQTVFLLGLMYIFSPFVGCAFAGGAIYGESEGVFEISQDMQYGIISHENGIQFREQRTI